MNKWTNEPINEWEFNDQFNFFFQCDDLLLGVRYWKSVRLDACMLDVQVSQYMWPNHFFYSSYSVYRSNFCSYKLVLVYSYISLLLPLLVALLNPKGLTDVRHHWFGMYFQFSYATCCALMTARNTWRPAYLRRPFWLVLMIVFFLPAPQSL